MAPLHENLPIIQFPTSPQVVERPYCLETGMLAVDGCVNRAVGYYKIDALPGECTLHGAGRIDSDDYEYNGENDLPVSRDRDR